MSEEKDPPLANIFGLGYGFESNPGQNTWVDDLVPTKDEYNMAIDRLVELADQLHQRVQDKQNEISSAKDLYNSLLKDHEEAMLKHEQVMKALNVLREYNAKF